MSAAQTIPFPIATTSTAGPSSSQKENAPLTAPTLLAALDKGVAKGRKRTITLVNGGEHIFNFCIAVAYLNLTQMKSI